MKKKKEVLEIIERLKQAYPLAACTLDYASAWQLLVSVRLAAQCTDARVNVVTEDLFAIYPSVQALAEARPDEIEAIVKPCGLGHSKARDISLTARKLVDEFDGKVPDDFDTLLTLPGVGRKSANLIMGDVFGKPALSPTPTAYGSLTALAWCRTSKTRKKWRWLCGRSSPLPKAMIFATGWCCMAVRCVLPAARAAQNVH